MIEKCFLEICEILDELNITFFLVGGVLLGAKRIKNLLNGIGMLKLIFLLMISTIISKQ